MGRDTIALQAYAHIITYLVSSENTLAHHMLVHKKPRGEYHCEGRESCVQLLKHGKIS